MNNSRQSNLIRQCVRRRICAAWILPLLLLAQPATLQAQFTYVTNNGTITITGYTGPSGAITIPGTINGRLVTGIGDFAFYNGGVPLPYIPTSVTIPNSITTIGYYAFAWCGSLNYVTLGDSRSLLSSIGTGAFGNCGLITITIPSRVATIGDSAFAYCGALTGVYFQGNAPSPGSAVFAEDNNIVFYLPGTTGWGPTFGGRPTAPWDPLVLWIYTTNNSTITISRYTGPGGAVTIPSTINGLPVTSLEDAFWRCTSLTSVTIPSSITNIGNDAFYYCTSLTSVTIPNSVARIGQFAFGGCTGLISVTTGNGVTTINAWTFDSCTRLTSVTIGHGVTRIEPWAFQYCTSLTNVAIPSNVTSISGRAFAHCTSQTAITVDPSNSAYSSSDGVLFDKSQTTLIQCPEGKAGSYTIPNSVSSIEYEAFYSCTRLTSVTIPNSVTSIGDQAFYWCTLLAGVYFKGNAPSLGGSLVFSGDGNATVYYLPGTTGWGPTFGGRPTALWNPQVQTGDAGFGVRSNRFGFTITGTTNIPIVVETCTNLASASWTPLQTCTITNGSIYFSDPDWTNYPARFYRIRSP